MTLNDMPQDYYKILGVDRTATAADIKHAYKGLAMRWHPDKSSDGQATERFQIISNAYAVLSDESLRLLYDNPPVHPLIALEDALDGFSLDEALSQEPLNVILQEFIQRHRKLETRLHVQYCDDGVFHFEVYSYLHGVRLDYGCLVMGGLLALLWAPMFSGLLRMANCSRSERRLFVAYILMAACPLISRLACRPAMTFDCSSGRFTVGSLHAFQSGRGRSTFMTTAHEYDQRHSSAADVSQTSPSTAEMLLCTINWCDAASSTSQRKARDASLILFCVGTFPLATRVPPALLTSLSGHVHWTLGLVFKYASLLTKCAWPGVLILCGSRCNQFFSEMFEHGYVEQPFGPHFPGHALTHGLLSEVRSIYMKCRAHRTESVAGSNNTMMRTPSPSPDSTRVCMSRRTSTLRTR